MEGEANFSFSWGMKRTQKLLWVVFQKIEWAPAYGSPAAYPGELAAITDHFRSGGLMEDILAVFNSGSVFHEDSGLSFGVHSPVLVACRDLFDLIRDCRKG